MDFDVNKSLKKIETASHFFVIILMLNFIFLTLSLINYPEGVLFYVISFLITALICAVFIQTFNTIAEHLSYLGNKNTNDEDKE